MIHFPLNSMPTIGLFIVAIVFDVGDAHACGHSLSARSNDCLCSEPFSKLGLEIFENVQSLGDLVFRSEVNALCTRRVRPVTSLTAQHQWPDVVGQTSVIRR